MISTLRADMARMASMQLPWVIASPVICDSAGLADAAHALLMDGNEPNLAERLQDDALPLKLLMVLAGILLLVACVNLANLVLARIDPPTRDRCKAWHSARAGLRGTSVSNRESAACVQRRSGALALFMAWAGTVALVRMARPEIRSCRNVEEYVKWLPLDCTCQATTRGVRVGWR
jgi:hypothetical protein